MGQHAQRFAHQEQDIFQSVARRGFVQRCAGGCFLILGCRIDSLYAVIEKSHCGGKGNHATPDRVMVGEVSADCLEHVHVISLISFHFLVFLDNVGNRAISTYAVPQLPSITAPADVRVNTTLIEAGCGTTISDDVLGNATAVSNSSGTVTIMRSGMPTDNFFSVGAPQA